MKAMKQQDSGNAGATPGFEPRSEPVRLHQWGEGLEPQAVMQMEKACLLPVALAGALMPDAHLTVLGEFMPRLVKMAPSGERPED
jgi:hypothetical protein